MKIFDMKTAQIKPDDNELIVRIGEKIRELRKQKNISYEKLAKEIGLDRNTVNLIELGKTNFQFQTLLSILSYHKISVFDFFKSLEQ